MNRLASLLIASAILLWIGLMDLDLERLSPVGRKMIEDVRVSRALEKRLFVSTADAMRMLGMRETRIRSFMSGDDPVFPSILDGRTRRLAIGPLYDYLEKRIAAGHHAKGAA
jgi:hypothetical protein